MAKPDSIYSMFGMKTPQQVMDEEFARKFQYMQGQRSGYQQAGAGIGLLLGSLFGGKSAQLQQAEDRDQAYSDVERRLAEKERNVQTAEAQSMVQDLTPDNLGAALRTERRVAERQDPFNQEVAELNTRAERYDLLAEQFSALGQPASYVDGLKNASLQTRMAALSKQREAETFKQTQVKNELDIEYTKARIGELQDKDKLSPAELAEIQLKSTPESYQAWLKGTGTLVPNPKALTGRASSAIQNWNQLVALRQQDPSGKSAEEFFALVRSSAPFIKDLNDRFVLLNPMNPTQEIGSIAKGISPEQQPQAVTERKIAEGVGEEVTESRVKAPGQLMQMSEYDAQLQDLLTNPGSPAIFGFGGETRAGIAGTDAFGAASKLEQVQGSAFLSAVPQMKGLGALSDAEGRAITASVNALKIGLPWDQAKKEIAKVRTLLARGQERIKENQLLTPEQVLNNALGLTEERTTSGGIRYKIIGQ